MLALADGYLREKATGIRDDGHLVLRHLRHEDKKGAFAKLTILIAEELRLSQMTLVSHENLAGIALRSGGVTSYAAILAPAYEIRTEFGVEYLMCPGATRDILWLLGDAGLVHGSPS